MMIPRSMAALLPTLSLAVVMVLDLLPLPSAAPLTPAPSLTIAVFFFWTVHRPDLLPPVALFGLGALFDAVAGLPIAATSATLLLGRVLLLSGQRWLQGQYWPIAWACFLPVVGMLVGLRWALVSLLVGRALPLMPGLLDAGLTFLVYPPIAALLAQLQRPRGASTRAAA